VLFKFLSDINLVDIEEYHVFDEVQEQHSKLDPIEYLKPKSNEDYIGKIRNRLQEDAHARKEREKRRRKVLVDQLKANEALEVFLSKDVTHWSMKKFIFNFFFI
jgi:hypothetical protein